MDKFLKKLKELAQIANELRDAELPLEFHIIIDLLCQEAPSVAQAISIDIQQNITGNASPELLILRPRKRGRAPDAVDKLRKSVGTRKRQKIDRVRRSTIYSYRTQSLAENKSKKSVGVTNTLHSSPSNENIQRVKAEHREPVKNSKEHTNVCKSIVNQEDRPAEGVPPTPIEETAVAATSLRAGEIGNEKLTVSQASDSSQSTVQPPSKQSVSLLDSIVHAARTLSQLKKCPDGISDKVHFRILQTLQSDPRTAIQSNSDRWSDGTMWMQVLERGYAANTKVTIYNMLEYMGAWEWYDAQIQQTQISIRTKKNKLVDRRGAAIHVLNNMQRNSVQQGKWIVGLGEVALIKTEPNSQDSQASNISIPETDRMMQRKRISLQLSRGQKLSTKLVKELGVGILLSPKIWNYTKQSVKQLDLLIKSIQADPQQMKLLRILSDQLKDIVSKGSPDLPTFYQAVRDENLIQENELKELQMLFPEQELLPGTNLDVAVDRLIAHVGMKISNKKTVSADDTISINGSVELSCDIFQQLRYGQWFDSWMIMAAMHISDKPFFVQYGESVPLDILGRHNRRKSIIRPFAGWAKRIAELRKQATDTMGEAVKLVYFCPVNHRNEHFTLLEINDMEQVIRHYDSLADSSAIDGTAKTRICGLVQAEFSYLRYKYSEAPTPQQKDGWSCGARVVWNFRRLSNGYDIGSWDTILSPETMKMEIVNGLMMCCEANRIQKYQRTIE